MIKSRIYKRSYNKAYHLVDHLTRWAGENALSGSYDPESMIEIPKYFNEIKKKAIAEITRLYIKESSIQQ